MITLLPEYRFCLVCGMYIYIRLLVTVKMASIANIFKLDCECLYKNHIYVYHLSAYLYSSVMNLINADPLVYPDNLK